jgi:hypothetical protein
MLERGETSVKSLSKQIYLETNGSNTSVLVAPLFVQVLLSERHPARAKAFPPIGFRLYGLYFSNMSWVLCHLSEAKGLTFAGQLVLLNSMHRMLHSVRMT